MKTQKTKKHKCFHAKKRSGFTIIEALVFVAIFTVMAGLLTLLLANQLGAWARVRLERTAVDGGALILGRLSQEAQLAERVVTSTSVFGASPGRLELIGFLTPTSSVTTTVSVQMLDGAVHIKRQGAATTTLNATSTLLAQEFRIDRFATATSEGVRMQITVQAARGAYSSQKTLTGAAVLKGK